MTERQTSLDDVLDGDDGGDQDAPPEWWAEMHDDAQAFAENADNPVAVYQCPECGTYIPVKYPYLDRPFDQQTIPCFPEWGGCDTGKDEGEVVPAMHLVSDGFIDASEWTGEQSTLTE